MKNKIYAISLLLSFLVVLSHEMIIHHHHDALADGLFDCQSYIDAVGEKCQVWNTEDEHDHPFPLHHHVSATKDFVSGRTNLLESNPLNKFSTLFVVSDAFQHDFFEPPNQTNSFHRNKAFLISSLFFPRSNPLRGPPSIV